MACSSLLSLSLVHTANLATAHVAELHIDCVFLLMCHPATWRSLNWNLVLFSAQHQHLDDAIDSGGTQHISPWAFSLSMWVIYFCFRASSSSKSCSLCFYSGWLECPVCHAVSMTVTRCTLQLCRSQFPKGMVNLIFLSPWTSEILCLLEELQCCVWAPWELVLGSKMTFFLYQYCFGPDTQPVNMCLSICSSLQTSIAAACFSDADLQVHVVK